MPSDYWYYGVCVSLTGFSDALDEWPRYFANPPKVGDYITSKTGRRLQVCAVNYKYAGENQSIMYLELNRESSNNITPTEGGQSSGGYL